MIRFAILLTLSALACSCTKTREEVRDRSLSESITLNGSISMPSATGQPVQLPIRLQVRRTQTEQTQVEERTQTGPTLEEITSAVVAAIGPAINATTGGGFSLGQGTLAALLTAYGGYKMFSDRQKIKVMREQNAPPPPTAGSA